MSLFLIGLNHRTAPVQVRERLAFGRQGASAALMLFRRQFPGAEAAILSTCNRVEMLVSDDDDGEADQANDDAAAAPDRVIRFLAQVRDVPETAFRPYLYRIAGAGAIGHVFRVISGPDSMVLGETQIVNQLKQAHELGPRLPPRRRGERLRHHDPHADQRPRAGRRLRRAGGAVQPTGRATRRRQVALCERMIEGEVAAFEKWLAESRVRPLIERMFEDVRALAAVEVRGFFRRCPDLTERQRDAVQQLADRLVAKLMHPCVRTVREQGADSPAAALADALRDTRLSFDAKGGNGNDSCTTGSGAVNRIESLIATTTTTTTE